MTTYPKDSTVEVYPTDMQRDVAKYNLARKLRSKGKSIRAITRMLQISSSSASIWCRDIELSAKHKAKLAKQSKNTELLRKFAKQRHEDKINHDTQLFDQSKNEINKIGDKELFLLGLALYWAEGFKSKKEKQVGFCNSDPRMVKFILNWFKKSLNIPNEYFVLRAEFNISHKDRKEEIELYWSKLTGIPKAQFIKPYFQRTQSIKDYSYRDKYYGLLRIRVRKSSVLLVKLRGWIEGLALN